MDVVEVARGEAEAASGEAKAEVVKAEGKPEVVKGLPEARRAHEEEALPAHRKALDSKMHR